MIIPLDVFPYFIEASIEQRILEIGGSDLLIEFPDSNLHILIGHESDIHLDRTHDEAINKIVASFSRLNLRTAEEWKAADRDESNAKYTHQRGITTTLTDESNHTTMSVEES